MLAPAQELGNNAVHFNMMVNSRVRRVRIHNSNSAFYSCEQLCVGRHVRVLAAATTRVT
jgi:hypothetical protein